MSMVSTISLTLVDGMPTNIKEAFTLSVVSPKGERHEGTQTIVMADASGSLVKVRFVGREEPLPMLNHSDVVKLDGGILFCMDALFTPTWGEHRFEILADEESALTVLSSSSSAGASTESTNLRCLEDGTSSVFHVNVLHMDLDPGFLLEPEGTLICQRVRIADGFGHELSMYVGGTATSQLHNVKIGKCYNFFGLRLKRNVDVILISTLAFSFIELGATTTVRKEHLPPLAQVEDELERMALG